MQGHCNAITCMQATVDRLLLITADAGHNTSLLVLWDPATGQPVSTVQQPHAAGVLAMAVSADGQQLATLSAPTGDSDSQIAQQEVGTVLWIANRHRAKLAMQRRACTAAAQMQLMPIGMLVGQLMS